MSLSTRTILSYHDYLNEYEDVQLLFDIRNKIDNSYHIYHKSLAYHYLIPQKISDRF